jgi:hypothetical protein
MEAWHDWPDDNDTEEDDDGNDNDDEGDGYDNDDDEDDDDDDDEDVEDVDRGRGVIKEVIDDDNNDNHEDHNDNNDGNKDSYDTDTDYNLTSEFGDFIDLVLFRLLSRSTDCPSKEPHMCKYCGLITPIDHHIHSSFIGGGATVPLRLHYHLMNLYGT